MLVRLPGQSAAATEEFLVGRPQEVGGHDVETDSVEQSFEDPGVSGELLAEVGLEVLPADPCPSV